MKCDEAIMLIGLPESDPRAVEMRAHIRACAKCRAVVDHQNNVRTLIALKRYEQPAAGFSDRCAAKIRLELEQQPVAQPAWWQGWSEHFGAAFRPLRLAAAAVLLLSAGLYFLWPAAESPVAASNSGSIYAPSSWAQIRPEPSAAPAQMVVIRAEPAPSTFRAGNPPLLMAASNGSPLRMDYGPGSAVPVKFDY